MKHAFPILLVAAVLAGVLLWRAPASPEKTPDAPPGQDTPATPSLLRAMFPAPSPSVFRRDRLFSGARNGNPGNGVGDVLPRLSGTFVGPDGRRALFAEPDNRSRELTEGAVLGHHVIRAILPGMVVLDGPEGERVLYTTHVKANP